MSDSLLTWAASVGSIFNGISRVGFGYLADKYSFRPLMAILMTVNLVNSMVCFWAANIPALYFICVIVNYAVQGGIYTFFPVSVTKVFGMEQGPTVYVGVLFGGIISAVINLVNSKYLLPVTSFECLFFVGTGTQVATLILIWWFKEELDVDRLAKYDGLKPMLPTKTIKK